MEAVEAVEMEDVDVSAFGATNMISRIDSLDGASTMGGGGTTSMSMTNTLNKTNVMNKTNLAPIVAPASQSREFRGLEVDDALRSLNADDDENPLVAEMTKLTDSLSSLPLIPPPTEDVAPTEDEIEKSFT